jgi:hypothetical protein
LRKRKWGLFFIRWKGGQRESTSQSSVIPLLKENVRFLKGSLGAQLDRVTRCVLTMVTGLDSPDIGCYFPEVVCLGWQVYCAGAQ